MQVLLTFTDGTIQRVDVESVNVIGGTVILTNSNGEDEELRYDHFRNHWETSITDRYVSRIETQREI